jgi:hypothetical protein
LIKKSHETFKDGGLKAIVLKVQKHMLVYMAKTMLVHRKAQACITNSPRKKEKCRNKRKIGR